MRVRNRVIGMLVALSLMLAVTASCAPAEETGSFPASEEDKFTLLQAVPLPLEEGADDHRVRVAFITVVGGNNVEAILSTCKNAVFDENTIDKMRFVTLESEETITEEQGLRSFTLVIDEGASWATADFVAVDKNGRFICLKQVFIAITEDGPSVEMVSHYPQRVP